MEKSILEKFDKTKYSLIEGYCGLEIKHYIAGSASAAQICYGAGFETDMGKVFAKVNGSEHAVTLFEGEYRSLECIKETSTLTVPNPIKVIDSNPAMLVMEYFNMKPLLPKCGTELGNQLARMHLHNQTTQDSKHSSIHHKLDKQVVNEFGFPTPTCLGTILQDNTWTDDWTVFFTRNKLQPQVSLLENVYRDREVKDLWPQVLRTISHCFSNTIIQPALLHGDLHSGNIAMVDEKPVVFDPSSFYGHSEFDLSVADMFGKFPQEFWDAYHSILPKQPGFDKRKRLYDLFHWMSHWNHFGPSAYMCFREKTLNTMKEILKDN